jgi:hypothetical protein
VKSSTGRSISYFTTQVSQDLENSQPIVLQFSSDMIFSEEDGFLRIKRKISKIQYDAHQKYIKVDHHLVWKLIDPDVKLESWLRTRIAHPRPTVKLTMWFVLGDMISGTIDNDNHDEPIGTLTSIAASRALSISKRETCFVIETHNTVWEFDESKVKQDIPKWQCLMLREMNGLCKH